MYIAQNYDVPKVTVLVEKLKTYVVSTAHMLRKQPHEHADIYAHPNFEIPNHVHAFSLATLSLSTLNQKQTTLDLDVVHTTAAATCSNRWHPPTACNRLLQTRLLHAFRVADQSSGFSFITDTSIVLTHVCSIEPSCRSNLVDHPCSRRLVSPRPCRARTPWCAL